MKTARLILVAPLARGDGHRFENTVSEQDETLILQEVVKHRCGFCRFKTQLMMCWANVSSSSCFEQGVGLGDLKRFVPS